MPRSGSGALWAAQRPAFNRSAAPAREVRSRLYYSDPLASRRLKRRGGFLLAARCAVLANCVRGPLDRGIGVSRRGGPLNVLAVKSGLLADICAPADGESWGDLQYPPINCENLRN